MREGKWCWCRYQGVVSCVTVKKTKKKAMVQAQETSCNTILGNLSQRKWGKISVIENEIENISIVIIDESPRKWSTMKNVTEFYEKF